MSRRVALVRVSELTGEQWGMVTAGQAAAAGVSAVDMGRLVADGLLEAVPDAARVYRLAGSPEDPDLDGVRAAWLQLGGARRWHERIQGMDAVASHRTAAHVHDLGDLIPAAHEFDVTRRRQPRRRDLRLHLRTHLSPEEWTTSDGLPVTTIARIITDLLADVEDESGIAGICHDAAARGLLATADLSRLVTPFTRRYEADSPEHLAERLLAPETTAVNQ
ncbi:MAG: type IV toxin-antitoxin system AbiEi family antitoxin domain-containing protein [Nocardioidaceae bacterium]